MDAKLHSLSLLVALTFTSATFAQQPVTVNLPDGRILTEVPGHPRPINNLPTAAALSPDKKFAVFLHSGYGAYSSGEKQSLTVLNLETNELTDFPDDRLGQKAHQTFFLGLAFSLDGTRLYASVASFTDPLGKNPGDTGNGIAIFKFENGKVTPEKFLPLAPRTNVRGKLRRTEFDDVTYPAGLSVAKVNGAEAILVACNQSDEAILLNASDGKILHRFDLATFKRIPASLPYTTAMTRDGKRGFVSLWNASSVAVLDLVSGKVTKVLPLEKPTAPLAGGSHPTALLLNHDDSILYVALTNRDEIDALNTTTGKTLYSFSTKIPGQKYGGSDPMSLALSPDEKILFSANAISDTVGVFDLSEDVLSIGMIPTEWYPTAVLATPNQLLIATAKGRSSGPNPKPVKKNPDGSPDYPYTPALIHGSLAQISLSALEPHLADYTKIAVEANSLRGNSDKIQFAAGENKIKHVIYMIKENRTYDQILGDLGYGDGDPSLTMYGADITPNLHKIAKQFGVLDNFYDSGDVSGDGHIWSNSASISDYVAKTWPIAYRGEEHTYDSEGTFLNGISADDGLPDAGEPTGGFLWKNFSAHGITYRHYGEFIVSKWCNSKADTTNPKSGPPKVAGITCKRTVIKKGEPLENNVGEPHGGPSPYPWEIPVLAKNIAAEAELRGHFDPRFPDFEVSYPDQLRADEFLNEFNEFVAARKSGKDTMPQFIQLRLPNDHTAGLTKNQPRPAASVADNDLAIGRVVDALSHSPYWNDTAVLILEDDAQDGPDHVDSHRSTAYVISKYSPLPQTHESITIPFIDHTFYTTINMVRTIEVLLGVPPMNSNDARAAAMAPLFTGPGTQPPFTADYRNRENGLIYETNVKDWKEGANLDFSHADAVDTAILNKALWQDLMGEVPMPPPQHNVFPAGRAIPAGNRATKTFDPD